MIKIYVMESCPDCTEVKALFTNHFAPVFKSIIFTNA